MDTTGKDGKASQTEQAATTDQRPRAQRAQTTQAPTAEGTSGGAQAAAMKPATGSVPSPEPAKVTNPLPLDQDAIVQAAQNGRWEQVIKMLAGSGKKLVALDNDHQRRLLDHVVEAMEYDRLCDVLVKGYIFDKTLIQNTVLRALEQKWFPFAHAVLFKYPWYSLPFESRLNILRHFSMDDAWMLDARSVLDVTPGLNLEELTQLRDDLSSRPTSNQENRDKLLLALDARIFRINRQNRNRNQTQ